MLVADGGAVSARRLDGGPPFSVAVACGAVFVHPRPAAPPLPHPDRFRGLGWAPARSESVPVPWTTIAVNAFDLHHLRSVHRRELAAPPTWDRPAPDHLRVRYATRPVGRAPSDRVMRWLSGNHLDIQLTLVGGSVLWVEVDLGRTRTTAVVGLSPRGEDTTVLWLAVGVPRAPGWSVRARLARWLYTTFLRRDLPVLTGLHLQPRSALPEDDPVQRVVAFLEADAGITPRRPGQTPNHP